MLKFPLKRKKNKTKNEKLLLFIVYLHTFFFMKNPSEIANYFISKYGKGNNLTPMKLIKLVYIAYGWYLALTKGEKLVQEQPQAWNLGPVFPSLYEALKNYGNKEVNDLIPITVSSDLFDKSLEKFLNIIWQSYGNYDGIYLSSITHSKKTPWTQVFPLGFNVVIPDKLIKQHYLEKLEINKKDERATA